MWTPGFTEIRLPIMHLFCLNKTDAFLSCLFDLQGRVLPEDPQNTQTHSITTVSNLRPTPPTHSVNVLIRGFIMTHILTIKQHLETPPETLCHTTCVFGFLSLRGHDRPAYDGFSPEFI